MFRFTIRDVLWLTVLVAVSVLWWIDHRKQLQVAAEQRNEVTDAKTRITKLERLWQDSKEVEKAIQEMGGYEFKTLDLTPFRRPRVQKVLPDEN